MIAEEVFWFSYDPETKEFHIFLRQKVWQQIQEDMERQYERYGIGTDAKIGVGKNCAIKIESDDNSGIIIFSWSIKDETINPNVDISLYVLFTGIWIYMYNEWQRCREKQYHRAQLAMIEFCDTLQTISTRFRFKMTLKEPFYNWIIEHGEKYETVVVDMMQDLGFWEKHPHFKAHLSENPVYIQVPGNASGICFEEYKPISQEWEFASHNIFSPEQRYTILAGIAFLWGKAREELYGSLTTTPPSP